MPAIVIAGVVASTALAASYLMLGVLHDARSRRSALRLERARRAIVGLLAAPAGDGGWDELGEVARLPLREIADLLSPLAVDLDGDALARIRGVAAAAGLDGAIERLAGSRRAASRLRAAQLAHLLPTGHRARAQLLSDPAAAVRGRAADGLAAVDARGHAHALGELLGDASTGAAFAAQQALLRAGAAAHGAVAIALEREDRRGVELALELAARLAEPRLAPAIAALAGSPEPRVRAQVAPAAAGVDPSGSTGIVAQLLADDDATVRAAAARAVGDARLSGLASALGRLLADASWDVRFAAASALVSLDAPGLLILRRGVASEDRFARDIARQQLDLVEGRVDTGWDQGAAAPAVSA